MKRYLLCLLVLLTLLSGLLITTTRVAHAAASSCINPSGTNVLQGTLGGANYTISVPSNWNGTLVLYSHGYVFPNHPLLNPAPDVGIVPTVPPVSDTLTEAALLQQGYALAGSSLACQARSRYSTQPNAAGSIRRSWAAPPASRRRTGLPARSVGRSCPARATSG